MTTHEMKNMITWFLNHELIGLFKLNDVKNQSNELPVTMVSYHKNLISNSLLHKNILTPIGSFILTRKITNDLSIFFCYNLGRSF